VAEQAARWRRDAELSVFGVGKVIGLGLAGRIPAPAFFEQQPRWAWFLAAPGATEQADALRALYNDARVLSEGGL